MHHMYYNRNEYIVYFVIRDGDIMRLRFSKVKLTPGNFGKDCVGNGEHKKIECSVMSAIIGHVARRKAANIVDFVSMWNAQEALPAKDQKSISVKAFGLDNMLFWKNQKVKSEEAAAKLWRR